MKRIVKEIVGEDAITDDGDYCTVPGIQVFTANRPVLAVARAQGNTEARAGKNGNANLH